MLKSLVFDTTEFFDFAPQTNSTAIARSDTTVNSAATFYELHAEKAIFYQ